MCTPVAEEHVGFQFSNRRMRRDLKREAAAATLWTNAHLSLSLNLVINYEREIIINICLPAVRPSMRTSSGRIWSWIGDRRLFFQAGNQRQTPSCEVGRIYLTLLVAYSLLEIKQCSPEH